MTVPELSATEPLSATSIEEAYDRQQRLITAAMIHLPDNGLFHSDVGVTPSLGRPATTAKVERVFADAFGAEDAAFVQGAGTGAIRSALQAGPWVEGDRRLLIHDAPIYSTTEQTFRAGLVKPVRVDFNDALALEDTLGASDCPQWVYVQHTRQQMQDRYSPATVIELARRRGKRVIVDDNYAVLRTPQIGVELGASASCFSLFKLHGPEGTGLVVGGGELVENIRRQNYSGGGQVQGHQALWALQAVIEGCLNWAKGSEQTFEVVRQIKEGRVPAIRDAEAGNLQDLCALILLDSPRAAEVRERASELGAATYPVGSNSRYEIVPMIYRMSGSSLREHSELSDWTLRVNPMRASAETVLRLLEEATR